MADEQPMQQQHGPGGHYSGQNKVPTINKFLASLDKDKRERDRQIDEQNRQKQTTQQNGDVKDHKVQKAGKEGTQKTVTDPVTGKEVTIEDVNKETIERASNPIVCLLLSKTRTAMLIQSSYLYPTPTLGKIR